MLLLLGSFEPCFFSFARQHPHRLAWLAPPWPSSSGSLSPRIGGLRTNSSPRTDFPKLWPAGARFFQLDDQATDAGDRLLCV